MNTYELVILFSYLIVQGLRHWLRFINLSHMKKFGTIVPQGFEDYINETTLKQTHAYTIESGSLALVESLFGSAAILLFFFGGLLNLYNSWVLSLNLPFVLQGTLYFLLLSYLSTLLSVPFSLYGTFRIENRYGFNTMTPRLWVTDLLKSTLITTILYSALLLGGFWIVKTSPDYWWFFLWGFLFVVSLFIMFISPYVIEPLFNKFTPLDRGDLEDRIKDVMRRGGIRVSRIFRMDASKRSLHSNAYFTGIGRVKRIVLYDTLLQLLSENEIIAVLAHEAGHWKKRHIIKMMALFELLSFGGMYITFRILRSDVLTGIFGIQHETFFAKLITIGFIFGIVSFPFTPLFSYLSRRHEREADGFATGLTSDRESLATSLVKLSKDNLSNLHPHPLYAGFYYSHPPVVERVKELRGQQ